MSFTRVLFAALLIGTPCLAQNEMMGISAQLKHLETFGTNIATLEISTHVGSLDLSDLSNTTVMKLTYQVSGYEVLDNDILNAEDQVEKAKARLKQKYALRTANALRKTLRDKQRTLEELKDFRSKWQVTFGANSKWIKGMPLKLGDDLAQFPDESEIKLAPLESYPNQKLVNKYAVKSALKVLITAHIIYNGVDVDDEELPELRVSAPATDGHETADFSEIQVVLKKVTQNQYD